jgi:hypothetical protein
VTTDRDETSAMTESKRSPWFTEGPRPKPDLLDPAVSPKDAFPDDVITAASPEFGGDVIDLNDQK